MVGFTRDSEQDLPRCKLITLHGQRFVEMAVLGMVRLGFSAEPHAPSPVRC